MRIFSSLETSSVPYPRLRHTLHCWLVLAALAGQAIHAELPTGPIHVDADAQGADDGSSWSDAFTSLEDALAVATDGREVWIAEGVYRPGPGQFPDQDATFLVPAGVTLIGGFAGGETQAEEADPTARLSILSGDLEGDDLRAGVGITALRGQRGTNVRHVVTLAAVGGGTAATLRGLVLTGGEAIGSEDDDRWASAVHCSGLDLVLEEVRVEGNHAASRAALGFCGEITARDSVFRGNSSSDVGAVAVDDGTYERCLFEGNQAFGAGSVFYLASNRLRMVDSVVRGHTRSGRAPLRIRDGESVFENVLFEGNAGQAGAIFFAGAPTATFTGVTWVGNAASSSDAMLFFQGNAGSVEIGNSVVWSNRSALPMAVEDGNGIAVTVRNSILENGVVEGVFSVPGVIDGGGNSATDPLFASVPDAADAPFSFSNPRLLPGSPALDAGDDSLVTTSVDLDGRPRIAGAGVDLGAYEGEVEPADLGITKFGDLTVAVPGADTIRYTLVATNHAAFPVTARVLDPVDGLHVGCSWTATPSVPGDGPVVQGVGGVNHLGQLSAGAHVTVELVCAIDASARGTLVDTATVRSDDATVDPDPANDTATVATPLDQLVDLRPSVAISAVQEADRGGGTKTTVERHEAFRLALLVDNAGPSSAFDATLRAEWPGSVLSCEEFEDRSTVPTVFEEVLSRILAGGRSVRILPCVVLPDAPLGEFTVTLEVSAVSDETELDPTDNLVHAVFEVVPPTPLFADGFESGGLDGWN